MKYLLIVLGFIFTFSANCQEKATIKSNRELRAMEKEHGENSILSLKDGVLLVRLNFKENEIAYYERFENFKEAQKIREKQDKINQEILNAFNTHYSFSPIYFFGMHDSRKILSGSLDSVIFYNSELRPDTSIKVETENWLIAEFGAIEQDTSAYYSDIRINNESSTEQRQKTYYGGSKNTMSALVIFDKQFKQLRDPFPFYARYSPVGSVKKRYLLPVMKLNERLSRYYDKVQKHD